MEEDGREVNANVGCKAEGKSMAVTLHPVGLLSLLTFAAMCTPIRYEVSTLSHKHEIHECNSQLQTSFERS